MIRLMKQIGAGPVEEVSRYEGISLFTANGFLDFAAEKCRKEINGDRYTIDNFALGETKHSTRHIHSHGNTVMAKLWLAFDDGPIVIEVCERLMDRCYGPKIDEGGKIVVSHGSVVMEEKPKYHAQIANVVGRWASGRSVYETVGDLIMHHPECFGIKVVHLEGKLPR